MAAWRCCAFDTERVELGERRGVAVQIEQGCVLEDERLLYLARSGAYVGKIKGDYVFDPSGRYAGTIVGERVVYRCSTHSARVAGPSVSANRGGSGAGNRGASGMWGDEPPFPD